MQKSTIAMTLLGRLSELPSSFDPAGNPEHKKALEELVAAAESLQDIPEDVSSDADKVTILQGLFRTANAFTIDGPVMITRKGKNFVTRIDVSDEGVRFEWKEGSLNYESFFPVDELNAAVYVGNEWTIVDNKGNPHRFGFFSLYRIQNGNDDPLINEGSSEYVMTGKECVLSVKSTNIRLVAGEEEVLIACSTNNADELAHIGTLRMSLPSPRSQK